MGIDLSLNCPGVAVLNANDNKILYIDNYPIKDKKQCKYFRYLEIKLWLNHIMDLFNPEMIIIEEAFMSSLTIKSNVPLLNLHGYICHFLFGLGIEIYKIMPSSARSYLQIKPNKKEVAYEWVCNKYPNLEFVSFKKDNDKTDSIILTLNHDNAKLKKIFEK